jgi:uncharacterized protein (DUF1778 family)
MQLSPHVEAVQADLAAVADAAGPEQAGAVRRVAAALAPSLRLHLLEAVTEAAHEVSAQLPAGRVELRLEAGDPSLAYLDEAPAPAAFGSEDASARITLRLPEALKAGVETAAAREGVSVNSWLVQALARAVESRPSRGNRLTGFARS